MKPKHSPTPWTLCQEGELTLNIYASDGEPGSGTCVDAFCLDGEYITPEEERANAERIVACVNACEGVDDPAVLMPTIGALEDRAELAERRNLHLEIVITSVVQSLRREGLNEFADSIARTFEQAPGAVRFDPKTMVALTPEDIRKKLKT